jgi:DNA-binding transcriptional LysR family regulator
MGWEPELVVAVDVVVSGEFLRRVLARFAPASRGTRVRIERHAVADAALAAMSDRFDLVLTASLPPGVHPRPLGSVAMTAVVSKSHALAGASGREALLSRELQIVIGDTYTGAHEEGWLRSERRWTVPDFAVARSVLAAGQGFCIVPRQMFVSELAAGELVEIAPEHTRTMDVHLVLPKGDSIGPSAQRLRDCVLAEPLSSVALATT